MEFKLPERFENSNKSTYGSVLNVAGSDYMPGAAYLSSISALKIGCGYCFLCSTDRVIDVVASKSSNIVFVPFSALNDALETCDVVEIGCGLAQNENSVKVFNDVISSLKKNIPVVVDADALNILSFDNQKFLNKAFEKTVFTPHPKEAARLLDWSLDGVLSNIEFAAKQITNIYNCVTVLKTHNTFVCSPDGREYRNLTGNNSMAKAGSGDVLTGMIAGLIAQGMDIFEASSLGVHLHGLCGDIAKNRLTEYSVLAEDLISSISESIKLYTSSN